MSRVFDGFGDDSINLSPGALAAQTGGPMSFAILHRPASGFCGLFHNEKASATQFELWGEGSNYFLFPGGFSSGPAPVANIWQIIGVSKGAGTVTPRYQFVPLEGGGAGTWVPQNGTTTVADWSGPIDLLRIGHGQRKGNGLIAALAMWNRTFTDSEWVNSVGFTSAQQWFNTAPIGMWLLNQALTSDPVLDVTGNGANQIATTNPAVSANDPPGWSYTVSSLAVGSLFLPFFG